MEIPGTFNDFQIRRNHVRHLYPCLPICWKGCLPVTACEAIVKRMPVVCQFVSGSAGFWPRFFCFLSRRGRKGYRRVIRRAPLGLLPKLQFHCLALAGFYLFFTGNSSGTACQKKRLCFSRLDLFLYSVRNGVLSFWDVLCSPVRSYIKHCIPLIYRDERGLTYERLSLSCKTPAADIIHCGQFAVAEEIRSHGDEAVVLDYLCAWREKRSHI